ncbi:3-deoxy-D-manno-octulosonic-acid transferase [Inquilinus ginsengisoli]|uniref:3-deoxy-D-manno-octulosonic acid transferase n=1 Tax=Inquilinus ginsengisoli TaxID=363840 RepID=UPI003D1CFE19
MIYALYRGLTDAAGPFVPLLLARRTAAGREDPARRGERLGHASIPRPAGPLIWVHAASVGEVLSVQVLVRRLLERDPRLSVLVTTGTVTSARLIAERLPDRAMHQFAPLDRMVYVRRFLDHWKPNLAIWVESEIWPNMLMETEQRGLPIALVNARMSERSFRRWRRLPRLIRRLVGIFRVILPWDERSARNFRALGARGVGQVGNLKFSSDPPDAELEALAAMRAAIGRRPVWLASSTHAGEEEQIIQAHKALAAKRPGLLTVLAPRHPDRGEEIAGLAQAAGLRAVRRSQAKLPWTDTDMLVADTIGEMGIWLRVCPVAFIGGSLVPFGGHNPIEAAQLGAALVYGPHMTNFPDITAQLSQARGAMPVGDAAALTAAVNRLLDDPVERRRMARAAGAVAQRNRGVVSTVMATLEPLITPILA